LRSRLPRADVRLVRADKLNALDPPMFEGLLLACERLAKEPSLRAVVLSGEERAFCAGLDMGRFATTKQGGDFKDIEKRTHGISNTFQYVVYGWRELCVPVVAAVHGVAFGGGFQLMLGADIRLVAPDTRMSIMEVKWGLVPDMAGTALMRTLARDDVIRELTYTGRIFSAQEALAYGFATRISEDPHTEALALAREIATKSPDAIQGTKRLLNIPASIDSATSLLAEAVEQAKLIGSPNQIEAVKSNLEKRAALFADPDSAATALWTPRDDTERK